MGNDKVHQSKEVVSRRVGDEVVLVNLQSDQMYSLNSTGARTWELLGEGHNSEAIETTLSDEFGVDRAEARRELETFLDDLAREQLVERA